MPTCFAPFLLGFLVIRWLVITLPHKLLFLDDVAFHTVYLSFFWIKSKSKTAINKEKMQKTFSSNSTNIVKWFTCMYSNIWQPMLFSLTRNTFFQPDTRNTFVSAVSYHTRRLSRIMRDSRLRLKIRMMWSHIITIARLFLISRMFKLWKILSVSKKINWKKISQDACYGNTSR